jgi:hypothetical protein
MNLIALAKDHLPSVMIEKEAVLSCYALVSSKSVVNQSQRPQPEERYRNGETDLFIHSDVKVREKCAFKGETRRGNLAYPLSCRNGYGFCPWLVGVRAR